MGNFSVAAVQCFDRLLWKTGNCRRQQLIFLLIPRGRLFDEAAGDEL